MFGAKAGTPTEVAWPQAHSYNTDIAKAKQLLAEAGYPNGFETTLSFDLGFAGVNEPLCVLTQESLAQIGIKTTINKIPGANWRTELNKKVLPLYTNVFSGWLDYPEYFFIWCYHGKNSIFNTMSYQSKELDALIDGAVDAAAVGDKAKYEKNVKGFVDLAYADMPRIPLFQPYVNVAMQKNVSRLSVLVPPPARLSRAGEGVTNGRERMGCRRRVMLRQIGQRLRDRDPEPDRRGDRHLPADARAAGRSGGLFRRAGRDHGGDRGNPRQARARQVAAASSSCATSAISRKGDLGQSLTTGQPVVTEIRNRLPASAELTLLGLIVSIAIAIPLGILAAVKPNSWIDHACRVVTTAGVSLPVFFTGLHPGLRVLLSARLGAGAARAARRVLLRRRRRSPAST